MGTLIERLLTTDGVGQSGPIKKEAAERIAELELKMVKLRFEVNQYNGGDISADAALDGIHEILFGY